MIQFAKAWLELKVDRKGVTALEYALIAAVIGAVMVVGATTLGTSISSQFTTLSGKL